MQTIVALLLLCTSLSSHAICLNPFGCEPKSEAECIANAASAKTEAAAKAMIMECRRTSWVTLDQCKSAEKQWALYVAGTNGAEWDWPGIDTKIECVGKFPETFSPKLWVTQAYCMSNAKRLSEAKSEIDPVTLKSARMESVRRKLPELLAGLDDRHAVGLLQSVYYKDMTSGEIAAAVYLDKPRNPMLIASICEGLVRPTARQ